MGVSVDPNGGDGWNGYRCESDKWKWKSNGNLCEPKQIEMGICVSPEIYLYINQYTFQFYRSYKQYKPSNQCYKYVEIYNLQYSFKS